MCCLRQAAFWSTLPASRAASGWHDAQATDTRFLDRVLEYSYAGTHVSIACPELFVEKLYKESRIMLMLLFAISNHL